MAKIKILVAEDDLHIRTGLVDILESEGYDVIEAADGAAAISAFDEHKPDLLLLDVMMPGKSGYDVCQQVRSADKTTPIIMLTAKGEEIDKVVGLKLGADDYVTKPFGIHELLARVEAVLRRCVGREAKVPVEQEQSLLFGPFKVNPKTYTLSGPHGDVSISKRELKLLQLFAGHPGEVLDRDTLLNQVWGVEYGGTTRTLDQHIAMLRKKVEIDPAQPQLIITVHGIGYRFNGASA